MNMIFPPQLILRSQNLPCALCHLRVKKLYTQNLVRRVTPGETCRQKLAVQLETGTAATFEFASAAGTCLRPFVRPRDMFMSMPASLNLESHWPLCPAVCKSHDGRLHELRQAYVRAAVSLRSGDFGGKTSPSPLNGIGCYTDPSPGRERL